jgi:hypothetical protein
MLYRAGLAYSPALGLSRATCGGLAPLAILAISHYGKIASLTRQVAYSYNMAPYRE